MTVIYLLCKSYQGTRKIMQKSTKKKKTYKKTKKRTKKNKKNSSHGAYIVHNRLYIWSRSDRSPVTLAVHHGPEDSRYGRLWG